MQTWPVPHATTADRISITTTAVTRAPRQRRMLHTLCRLLRRRAAGTKFAPSPARAYGYRGKKRREYMRDTLFFKRHVFPSILSEQHPIWNGPASTTWPHHHIPRHPRALAETGQKLGDGLFQIRPFKSPHVLRTCWDSTKGHIGQECDHALVVHHRCETGFVPCGISWSAFFFGSIQLKILVG